MLKKADAPGLPSLRGQVTWSDFYIKNIILLAYAGNRLTRLRLGREKFWPSRNDF